MWITLLSASNLLNLTTLEEWSDATYDYLNKQRGTRMLFTSERSQTPDYNLLSNFSRNVFRFEQVGMRINFLFLQIIFLEIIKLFGSLKIFFRISFGNCINIFITFLRIIDQFSEVPWLFQKYLHFFFFLLCTKQIDSHFTVMKHFYAIEESKNIKKQVRILHKYRNI